MTGSIKGALALRLAAAALSLGCGWTALAHETGAPHHLKTMSFDAAAVASPGDVPIFDNLGRHSYKVSTGSALAQTFFDQGLRWAWGFNHGEALRAFRAAQAADPDCAMCYWGEAFVLGPNINSAMDENMVPVARAAVARAMALSERASAVEQGLIAALAERYEGEGKAPFGQAYADAMAELAARFPADNEIATLYADALMNLSPWDYWLDGGKTPKPSTEKILASFEGVLARNPDHPGAIHMYIHAVEASTTPERAEKHADRLAALMPGAGHIVHMPAHVYQRVGRWIDSLRINEKAVAADEEYFRRAGISPKAAPGLYTDGYYPHNLHFLMVSAQMAGDARAVAAAAEKLEALVSNETARQVAWLQPIKAAAYFGYAQYSDPETILSLPAPKDALPYVMATWHYARGVAFAVERASGDAQAEAEKIRIIAATSDFSLEEASGLPARQLLELAALIVEARIAQHDGRYEEAKARLLAAVEIEDKLAFMEPSFWYYPVRQTLGAVHLAMGETAAAEAAFAQALAQTPNNAWALWGLAQVHLRTGDKAKAAEAQQRFEAAWAGEPGFVALEKL